jgi:hypothetical protein
MTGTRSFPHHSISRFKIAGARVENARPSSEGERFLRTARGNDPPRMPGLSDPKINKRHLQRILKEFIRYYYCEKIHSGPGLPEENRPGLRSSGNRHRLPNTSQSTKKPVAGEVAPRLSLGIGSCVAEAPSLLRSTGANTEDRRARESDPVSPLRRTVFVELSPRLSPIILLG